ncbi:unnamed protein product, partial [Mesorhabditis belari]|uniref:Chitinase n=1 Tax=Mesorhabditis belari TaxID=2138241 RepID=A0AAF3F4X6_9BILA
MILRLLSLLSFGLLLTNVLSQAGCARRVVGYITSWGDVPFTDQQARLLTHLVFAFFAMDADGALTLSNKAQQRLNGILEVARRHPHLKVQFAVGGWENSQYFSKIASTQSGRANLNVNIRKVIENFKFDGVDLDWEYPVTGGAVEGEEIDRQNYVQLMAELKQELKVLQESQQRADSYLISFAGAAGYWVLKPGFDLRGLLENADFVNVMSYDYFGAWQSKWGAFTGPPAPLHFAMPKKFSGKMNVHATIKYYACQLKDTYKINMGVPFYGRFWHNVGEAVAPGDDMWRTAKPIEGDNKFEGGDVQWRQIGGRFEMSRTRFHEGSKTPFIWMPENATFVGYEDANSLSYKEHAGMCGRSAPLYNDYYPVCDPDDPGHACCGKYGYCGSGPEFCGCASCVDYGADPSLILKEPIRPERKVTWYTLASGEGRRGRCGPMAPHLDGGPATCNPDDPSAKCCSNGGYCGSTKEHCECQGCVDFSKTPDYHWKPVQWWTFAENSNHIGKCGPGAPVLPSGKTPKCDPDSNAPCCSQSGYCGNGALYCECQGCVDFKKTPNWEWRRQVVTVVSSSPSPNAPYG